MATQMIQAHSDRVDREMIRQSLSTPMLEREREMSLARAWRDDRNEVALHELVSAYMRLVVSMSRKFRHYGLASADLIQEGCVGLMQAAERFDPDREVRFSTYATWWIRAQMQDYVLRNWSIVRTGTTAAQKSLFFNYRRLMARLEDQKQTLNADEARDWVADSLAVNVSDVEAMEMRLTGSDQSLHAMIGNDSQDCWQDHLPDERPAPDDAFEKFHDTGIRSEWLQTAIGTLSTREQYIIRERRLSETGRTLEHLGVELGVSKERVRQIEKVALGKLREALLKNVRHAEDEDVLTDR